MSENLDNSLVHFAFQIYKMQEVRECLHTLQDQFDVNMNVALTALYATRQGLVITEAKWRLISQTTAHIEQACTQARLLRLQLKNSGDALYREAKEHELFLERCHLSLLFEAIEGIEAIAQQNLSTQSADNLMAYCHLRSISCASLVEQLAKASDSIV